MVQTPQRGKARVQRLADRVSAVFVPAVIALAVLTATGWWLASGTFGKAMGPAVATLIIACLCALGLATPTALLVASGRGAQLGIFIRDNRALESARAIDTVVVDKTGTLTEGQMTVCDYRVLSASSRSGSTGTSTGPNSPRQVPSSDEVLGCGRGACRRLPASGGPSAEHLGGPPRRHLAAG
jgi:P-type E1-E2 ATPase